MAQARFVNIGENIHQHHQHHQHKTGYNAMASNRPLSIILATDIIGGFGANGKIPWDIPEDRHHFKKITNGHIVVMGRKTYQDIANNYQQNDFLPGRESYVISQSSPDLMTGVTLCSSLRDFFNKTMLSFNNKHSFVIGGENLFIEALTWTNKIYFTVVKGNYQCDKFFPINTLHKNFKLSNSDHDVQHNYAFLDYQRVI